jgi:hypothetical protein
MNRRSLGRSGAHLPGPRLFLPETLHSSGLFLPPWVTDLPFRADHVRSGEIPFRAELRPGLPDLIVPPSALPATVDMVLCAPTYEDLGLGVTSLEEIIEVISEVPFGPAMLALSVLAAELHHHPRDRSRQLELAADLYKGEVLEKVKAFVEESPTHLAFDQRHVATLQRLLITYAADDSPSNRFDATDALRLGVVLLALASVLPHGDVPDDVPETPADWAAWARYTTLVGAWYDDPEIGEAVARAHAVYADVHADPSRAGVRSRCDIDRWMAESYELTVTEQVAGAFACAAVTQALNRDAAPRERFVHIEPGFLRNGAFKDKEAALRALISATREELAALTADGLDDPARLAWDHTAFERKPFLRDPAGNLRLISPRALVSWMTRGIHYRALAAADRRAHPRKKDATMSLIFLSYAGDLGEEAVRRLVAASHDTQVRQGVVRQHGENDYRIAKRRFQAPDIVLDYGDDVIAIEVFSGRISRDARTRLDAELLRKALKKATTRKLAELNARIDHLLGGQLNYDGLELARVKRVWPIVVLAGDPILQTPALWHYVQDTAPEAFSRDARVQRPLIFDLDDLEPLLALVEGDGHTLPELLARLAASPYASLPPRNWVHATFGGVPCRPAYVNAQIQAAMRLTGSALFPDSTRLANWSPEDAEAA